MPPDNEKRRVVLLRNASGSSKGTVSKGPDSSSAHGSRSESSDRFRYYVNKCRDLLGDLEVTGVSLEQLIKDGEFSKAAVDIELNELQKLVDDYSASHSEIMRLCERANTDTKPFLDRKQRFVIRHKAIRNLLLSSFPDNQNLRFDIANSSGLKLPKVEIPIFEGDFEKWSSWHKLFESLIHKNDGLDKMAKFSYLRSYLKGVPLTLVESFPFEGDYYSAAFTTIVDHYGDPMNRISRLLDGIQRFPSMKDKNQSLRGLISFYRANATALQITFQQNKDIDPLSQLLIHSFLNKSDRGTRQDWEREVNRRKMFATFAQFIDYMEDRCTAYERATANSTSKDPKSQPESKRRSAKVLATTTSKKAKCYYCSEEHTIYKCPKFEALSVADRQKFITEKGWCKKCLFPRCDKKCAIFCRKCKLRHNSLLHNPSLEKGEISQSKVDNLTLSSDYNCSISSESTYWIGSISDNSSEALLATVQVVVSNLESNVAYSHRALIDSASQSNLITSSLVKKLGLKYQSSSCNLSSIEGHQSTTQGCVTVQITAKNTHFTTKITCEIVDEIVDLVPQNNFDIADWKIPKNIILADNNFNVSAKVDLLLGLRIFWKILGSKTLHIGKNLPCFRNSKFGWLVTDDRDMEETPSSNVKNAFAIQMTDPLSDTIKKFWLLDESENKVMSFEEIECEKSFAQNTKRILNGNSGYFSVRLPFKVSPQKLGHSRSLALKQFFSLEKRLNKNPSMKNDYVTSMNDYLKLNHMREVNERSDETCYYMPHHAIIKETSVSTRLRNVFNASMPTSSGLSLNNCLMVGPVVQSDLLTVLMRFRVHQFVFTADIVKMYRQVRLHEDDTRFQRIFWRDDSSEPLKVYEIITLAFGTASAPFLATRCLKALAELDGDTFPNACSTLLNDFYVDDVLTGADTLDEILKIQQQLQEILLRGGFALSKWCSNTNELLSNIPEKQRETNFPFSLDKNDKVSKTLGLLWSSTHDSFQIKVNIGNFAAAHSKRHILSIIASIFDPLGFISPVTIIAKLLIQSLWTTARSPCSPKSMEHWDEEISDDLKQIWIKFASTLDELHDVLIPRHLFVNYNSHVGLHLAKRNALITRHSHLTRNSVNRFELHGFSDASEKAYGAVVYIRAMQNDEISSCLFFSKSRVAPLKKQSLPRLELCAAVLLCEVIEKVETSLKDLLKFDVIRLWTDSQIVLHWIASPSSRWLPFVANRVQKIQNLSNNYIWDYVHTKSNPADLLSRGVTPSDLKKSSLWWQGPNWLLKEQIFTSKTDFTPSKNFADLELRRAKRSLTFVTIFKSSIFSLSSNFGKLTRLVAWLSRFVWNAQSLGPRFTSHLKIMELRVATKTLVKLSQREYFSIDHKRLKAGLEVERSSQLSSLSPFIDSDNLIRVGGRLQHSDLSYDQQHPFVLHPKQDLSKLIIRYYHETHFHAGPQFLRSLIRRRFWILRINSAIRSCIARCTTCLRFKAETQNQVMAALPKTRVTPSRPFLITGVDYAGPFLILGKGGKHKVEIKAYIAIFVCFATKAIHLEMVSDLTSEAFLAALSRFTARRGVPSEIHSDNGKNFVGANNLLKKQFKDFLASNFEKFSNFVSEKGCQWHFIPPYAPHFGGLWEAGVKSVKAHLRFVVTGKSLNFEQWATFLAQIEACLNSRPLTVDSSDPNEPIALTPGHFLIGGPIVGLPNADLKDVPENRLKHWELIKAQTQRFWYRWSNEYLNTLQQKTKWRFRKNAVKINDIVIIKKSNTLPTCWPMGKISEIHPGSDGLPRVVTIRILDESKKPPFSYETLAISKIILLPLDETE